MTVAVTGTGDFKSETMKYGPKDIKIIKRKIALCKTESMKATCVKPVILDSDVNNNDNNYNTTTMIILQEHTSPTCETILRQQLLNKLLKRRLYQERQQSESKITSSKV